MKKFFFVLAFCFTFFSVFAEPFADVSTFEDIDSLFDDAADLPASEVVKEADSGNESDNSSEEEVLEVKPVVLTYGIRLNGNIDAALGYGAKIIHLNDSGETQFDQSGYLSFVNDFYISSRPVPSIFIYSDIKISLIKMNPSLDLIQLYLDYNLWNKVFISVGKKDIGWGQCRLFDSNTVLGSVGSSTILGSINIPLGTANFTGVAAYGGSIYLPGSTKIDINQAASASVSIADIHYAAQAEWIMFNTLFALNGHLYHESKTPFPVVLGVDIKKTFFGFDFYVHADTAVKFSNSMTYESWKHINSIAGFYRKWETPNLGFNIECRYRYDIATNKNNLEIGEEFGWNGFFGNRIAYVLVGYHNVFDGSGYITPGFVLKNVFPNAQLDTGLTINYTREKIDFTLGTKLTLSIGY